MWRGSALADLADEPALAVDRARLDELRLAAIEQRVDADLEVGANHGLIAELEALVAAHPLRERMRGQLILALYRAGRQADALETYRETRRVLVEELGIEPSSELRELERAILRQDPTLASAAVPGATIEARSERPRWRWPRSPLAIGTGLLLVAGAGTAAALIAARGDRQPSAAHAVAASEASSAAGAPIPIDQSTTVTVSQTAVTTAPSLKSSKVATEPRPARRSRGNRTARASQPVRAPGPAAPAPATRPRRQTPAAAPPPKPKEQPTTTGATTTAPAQPRWLTISDDFPDLVVDQTIWHVIRTGTEVDVTQANGRVEVSIGAGAVAGGAYNVIDGHYGTQCRFASDFDAQVDFTLIDWPESNGVFAGLNAFFADTAVGRQSSSKWGEQYAAWVVPISNGGIPGATDTSGSVRIARANGLMSAYVMHKGRWLRIATGRNTGIAVIGFQAMSTDDDFGHKAVRVAFDNFRIKAKDPTCPYQ
jgi:Bacterial transcriptional activator domain